MTRTLFLKHSLAALFVSLALLVVPFVAFAQPGVTNDPRTGVINNDPGAGGGAGVTNTPRTGVTNSYSLQNPLNVDTIPELLDRFFQAILIIVVPFAVLFIVYAGFRLILARGNPEELKTAKRHLLYTLVGIAIVISASIIINILIDTACQVDIRGVGNC